MNILYIGSSGSLSLTPFMSLLKSQHNIVAVGVNDPLFFDSMIITLSPISLGQESLALAATKEKIPLIDLSRSTKDIISQCKEFSIDVVLMSCYGKKLSSEIVGLATKGCFNLHPSLLPKYRGAEPIFWQLKAGDDFGVSWHYVTADFDAGAVVKQQKIVLDDGLSHAEISLLAADKGAELMEQLLSELVNDNVSAKEQDAKLSSYQFYPGPDDFVVDTNCTAQHAYNFMKATEAFGQTYQCQLGAHTYLLDIALDYDNNDSLIDVVVKGDTLYIPCNEGVLIARFTGKL